MEDGDGVNAGDSVHVSSAAVGVCEATWQLDELPAELRPDLLRLLGDRGVSAPVYVWCHGHDTGKHGRLWLKGSMAMSGGILGEPAVPVPMIRLEAHRAGPIAAVEVHRGDISGDAEDYEETDRWRLTCPRCDRSGDRNLGTVLNLAVEALRVHAAGVERGQHHSARVSWWSGT